jgi:hypothetical protein
MRGKKRCGNLSPPNIAPLKQNLGGTRQRQDSGLDLERIEQGSASWTFI